MKLRDPCKGCICCEINGSCGMGITPYISETVHCPCLNCIVKVICRDICEEFKKYDNYQKKDKEVTLNGE